MADSLPRPLSALLPELLARLTRNSGQAGALAPLWNLAAGPTLARAAHPSHWNGNQLVFIIEQKQWLAELRRHEPALRARLAEVLPGTELKGLVFTLP